MSATPALIRYDDDAFQLSENLDPQELSVRFMARPRLRVADVLRPADALRLYRHLAGEIDWNTFLVAEGLMYGCSAGSAAAPDLKTQSEAHEAVERGFAFL